MITTVDVETSWQKTENGGYDPSPFHPDNILVSVGINDEYYFTNHSERVDEGCYHKIQSILDKTTLLIGHNIKFDLMWLLESGFKYSLATEIMFPKFEYSFDFFANSFGLTLPEESSFSKLSYLIIMSFTFCNGIIVQFLLLFSRQASQLCQ